MWLSVTLLILSHPQCQADFTTATASHIPPSSAEILLECAVGSDVANWPNQGIAAREAQKMLSKDWFGRSLNLVWIGGSTPRQFIYFFFGGGGVRFYIGTSPCFEGYTCPNWKVTADGSFHGDIFVTENCCFVTLFPNAPWIIKGMMESLTRRPKTETGLP